MIKEVVIKGMKLYVVPNSAIFVSKKQVEQMKYQEQAKVDNIRELMEGAIPAANVVVENCNLIAQVVEKQRSLAVCVLLERVLV